MRDGLVARGSPGANDAGDGRAILLGLSCRMKSIDDGVPPDYAGDLAGDLGSAALQVDRHDRKCASLFCSIREPVLTIMEIEGLGLTSITISAGGQGTLRR